MWTPVEQYPVNPHYLSVIEASGEDLTSKTIEVWGNDFYQITARIYPDGFTHLSCKREDRLPIHDWRQLQQIKNEICGPEREAVEIYPAESRIVDTANEYHLWVFPEGYEIPFAFRDQLLMTPEEIVKFNRATSMVDRHGDRVPGKARQRPWQPGLTTGLGEIEDLVQAVHRLDDASGGKLVDDAMNIIQFIRGVTSHARTSNT